MNRIAHILLALLILVSSSGVLLNKHYCQGQLRSQAFFVQPPVCHEVMQEKQPACPYHGHTEGVQDNGCCDTRSSFIKANQPQFHSYTPFKVFAGISILLPCLFIRARISPVSHAELSGLMAFDLPPPGRPIRLLIQVFRI